MTQDHGISHMVGSLYDFSEAAEHEIVDSFKKQVNSNTNCHFSDRNAIMINASQNDDESLTCLVHSIKNVISMEKDRKLEPFEDEKISRISGTHESLLRAALPEKRMQAMMSNGQGSLIEHESIIRRWCPSTESKELGLQINLQLLGKVGDLCGCRVEHVIDSADLLVKADREQDIDNGILKLERLDKMMVDEMTFPRIYSFYILEGEISVDLQLIALKDLNNKRLVTTLVPKGSLSKSLLDLCVLVLVKGSDVLQVNLKPATSSQECRLWNDYVHNFDQVQDSIAAETPKEPKTQIDKWVSEMADTDVQVDAFRPESAMGTQHSVDVSLFYKDHLSPTKKPVTKRVRATRGNLNASARVFPESHYGHDGKVTHQENVGGSSSHSMTDITSTDKNVESPRQPPTIEPPYMPPLAIPSRPFSITLSRTSRQVVSSSSPWDVVGRGSKSGSLVDVSVPNEGCAKDETTRVIDSLQDTTKTEARLPQNTMNQKKAPTQAVVGGETFLVKSFEENVTNLLVLGLPRLGRVELVVDIGRLLVDQQYGSAEFKNRSFKTSEFSSVLPKGRETGFEPIFTNMLTARSSDAESIVNLRSTHGKRIFQQQPVSRKVTYLFKCKAKSGDQIVVEYDEDGDFCLRGSEVLGGTLDWHFPKRVWDARLRLTSERVVAMDYQRQVKGIVDNVKKGVSRDSRSFGLWTTTVDDTLSIESITLCRETLHLVTIYPDLILHLTEYQDLQVRQSSESKNIYIGSIQASDVMIKANRVWWGAKLSSINASTILKENMTLELGETARWTPSSIISKGVVRDLFSATKEIITRIDHIGFLNRGEGSSNSKANEKPSENTQDAAGRLRRVDPGFW